MKKKPLLFIMAFCQLSFSYSPSCTLVVSVDGLRNSNGTVVTGLFDSPEGFPEKGIMGKAVPISGNSARVVFDNLKPGRYAVAIIHDENRNGKLDTNAIGIPLEGFGFGNNAWGVFGPPSFKKASVEIVKVSVTQKLKMRYF